MSAKEQLKLLLGTSSGHSQAMQAPVSVVPSTHQKKSGNNQVERSLAHLSMLLENTSISNYLDQHKTSTSFCGSSQDLSHMKQGTSVRLCLLTHQPSGKRHNDGRASFTSGVKTGTQHHYYQQINEKHKSPLNKSFNNSVCKSPKSSSQMLSVSNSQS